ncbi:MAG: hypothetical protein J7L44_00780 [Candidatus Diapherotrites archaeon]|nr:hypothetical protein [Candidatus Diapherotrites archaeon]
MFVSPEIDLLIIAVVITLVFSIVSLVIRHKIVGKEQLRELKKKHAELKELMKKTDRESQKRLKELQIEVLEINMKMMRASLPTMGLSILIVLFLFPFLNTTYGSHSFPIVGSWIIYYIVVSVITSLAFQLVIKKLGKE